MRWSKLRARQLPEGFCVRLMERLERESERRERRETWLLGTAGVLCLLAVIAGLAWYLWYEPGVGLHLPDMPSLPDIPALPGLGSIQLPEPDFPAESRRLSLFYVFIAATFLALAGARPLPAQAQAPMPRKQTHTRTDKPGTPAAGRIPGLRNTPGRRSACTGPYRLPYDTGRQTHRREWTAISRRPTADGGQWAEGCEQGCGLWAVGCGHRTAGSE